jgi:hypothetical protein
MVRKYKRKKRGPVRAKKVTFDGIKFASGLERYMYQALKKAKIHADYEGCTFTLQEGFMFDVESYERQSNGKGDFVSSSFIIECKGRANESFPIRWKMFKKYVNHKMKHVTLYKPQNQKECDEVIKLILNKRK